MSDDGHAQTASTIFRKVWKSSRPLQIDKFTQQQLLPLSWRDLGLLLVQLVRPLEHIHDNSNQIASCIRCLLALAGTVTHMHTAADFPLQTMSSTVSPVNPAFVARMFSAIVRATATFVNDQNASSELAATVSAVLKCISQILKAPTSKFATDSVLDGLAMNQKPVKRRRIDNEPQQSFVDLLARILQIRSLSRAHRYVVRILRAQNGAVIKQGSGSSESMVRLFHALAAEGYSLCSADIGATSETYVGDVFASIRDLASVLPAASVNADSALPQHVEVIARLSLVLSQQFRHYIVGSNCSPLYTFCAEKRHRCYQWAALCRISTWISGWKQHKVVTEALAECSRLCWIHVTDIASADLQIWSLLLCESLCHLALDSPSSLHSSTPLFMASLEAQVLVFAALAPLLTRISRVVPELISHKVCRPLLLTSLRICERFLRQIPIQAASLGLFRSAAQCMDVVREEGAFERLQCSLSSYVFRPTLIPPVSALEPSSEDMIPNPYAEQEREDSEEVGREAELGGIFTSFILLTNQIADEETIVNDRGMQSLAALAFRAQLRWISMFAASARDNAGRQARQLESLKRINIGLVGDKTRMLTSATDWTRLQRIPMVCQSTDLGQESARNTFRPIAAQAIRFFTTLSVFAALGLDSSKPLLERCLVWDEVDSSSFATYSAEQAVICCKNLKTILSESEFSACAFSSLQTLASILGVRTHLWTRDLHKLRLPHVQIRSNSPPSSEALTQVGMKVGLCQVLLDTEFLKYSVVSTKSVPSSLALCSGQIWLDMIGNIVRHSSLRIYAGLTHTNVQFFKWWTLALSVSINRLLSIADSAPYTADMIRLACILPSHLMSWHQYLPITESTSRSFVLPPASSPQIASLFSNSPLRFPLIIDVIYFLACDLWRELPLLNQSYNEAAKLTLHVCRDVWGIALDALHLLRRISHYKGVRQKFIDHGLVEKLGIVVSDLTARRNMPKLLIFAENQKRITYEKEEAADPTLLSLIKLSEDLDLEFASEDIVNNSTGNDMVSKLLHESAQQRLPVAKQHEIGEYYSIGILSKLWTAFFDELLKLPVDIAFWPLMASGPRGSIDPQTLITHQAAVLEWLSDKDNVLFDALTPLLRAKEHLAHSNALWQAVEHSIPLKVIISVIKAAPNPDLERISISAALVLPALDTDCFHKAAGTVAKIISCLVDGVFQENGSQCQMALRLMAWRQRLLLSKCIRESTVYLEARAAEIIAQTAWEPSSNPQTILLSGSGMTASDTAINVPLELLTAHSSVFQAMFTGPFSESLVVQRGVRSFCLQDNHAALKALISIIRRCTLQTTEYTNVPTLASIVDENLNLNEIMRVLALAAFYDVRLAIVVLAWRMCTLFNEQEMPLLDAELSWLLAIFGEPWNAHFGSRRAANAVCGVLGSMLLFHLDSPDSLNAIKLHFAQFASSAQWLFEAILL
ncbi:hypothetical protein IWW36_001781 [Coemansia brasiliensis]|uniref:BTB domain-containing protein n=1 Tax=Coemansia brasiliensis TaxID=2650707 RepID=A0A9W8ID95_9FUNG|nr:hypothetical protein IWW36_001781 [Coemansia brasiliensis]